MSCVEPEVFHQLRIEAPPVDHKTPSSANDREAKVHVVYNGVSANSWLSPVGIRSQRRAPVISAACRDTIQDRARSANAVLGRRFHELDRQDLKRSEVLKGLHIRRREAEGGDGSEEEEEEEEEEGDGDGEIEEELCLRGTNSLVTSHRPNTSCISTRALNKLRSSSSSSARRPVTCFSAPCPRPGAPLTARSDVTTAFLRPASSASDATSLPDLTIRQLASLYHRVTVTPPASDSVASGRGMSGGGGDARCLGVTDIKREMTVLDDETISFRSISAMREALDSRVSPMSSNSCLTPSVSGSEVSSGESRAATVNKLYNRWVTGTRRDARGSSSAPPRTDQRKSGVARATRIKSKKPLKPLSYNEPDASAPCCPSGCRECFRACLASEDYVSKAAGQDRRRGIKSRDAYKHSWQKPAIKVIKREMPEFFMLSKAPDVPAKGEWRHNNTNTIVIPSQSAS